METHKTTAVQIISSMGCLDVFFGDHQPEILWNGLSISF